MPSSGTTNMGQAINRNCLEVAKTSSARQALLIDGDGATYLHFAFKHLYRFIRPGAVFYSNDTFSLMLVRARRLNGAGKTITPPRPT